MFQKKLIANPEKTYRQAEGRKEGQTEGWMEGQMDRPYFIGPHSIGTC